MKISATSDSEGHALPRSACGGLAALQRDARSAMPALPIWPFLAAGLLLLAQAPGATAAPATIYRCGPTYQQVPCTGGQALQVDDSRSPAQQQAAERSAASDRAAAAALVAERQERDKSLRQPARATGISHAAAAADAGTAAVKPAHGKPGKAGKSGLSAAGKTAAQTQDKTLYSLNDGSKKSNSAEARMPAR